MMAFINDDMGIRQGERFKGGWGKPGKAWKASDVEVTG